MPLEMERAGLKTVMWVRCGLGFFGFVFLFVFFLTVENVVATCQNYMVSHCDISFFF